MLAICAARSGPPHAADALYVYLPATLIQPTEACTYYVADDGSTYFAPLDAAGQMLVLQERSFRGLPLARASAGQVLPIPGMWPLRQRRPVALNLCRCEQRTRTVAVCRQVPRQKEYTYAVTVCRPEERTRKIRVCRMVQEEER